MRFMSRAMLAAALLMGGTGLAAAQGYGGPGYGEPGSGDRSPGYDRRDSGGPQYDRGYGDQGYGDQGYGGRGYVDQRYGEGYGTPRYGQGYARPEDSRNGSSPGYGGSEYGQGYDNQGSEEPRSGPGSRRNGNSQYGQGYGNRGGPTSEPPQGSRQQQRSALREQLQQLGFRNIRILDAAYLVRAITPDGRSVVMLVDPPAQLFASSGSPADRQGRSGSGSQNQASLAQPNQNAGQNTGQQRTDTMSASDVRSLLESRGFSNIQGLERNGETFTAKADWQGSQVDVTVNAKTREISEIDSL